MGGDIAGASLKKFIQKTVVDELTTMLGSEHTPFEFVRG